MTTSIPNAITHIAAFDCSTGDFLQLEADAAALFKSGQVARHLGVLFGLFERFPEQDHEVFWGIMHGLEDTTGYELALLDSIQRQPSSMGLIMVNRKLNADELVIGNVNLLDLLHQVAANSGVAGDVCAYAQQFIEHQQQRATNG